VQQSKELKMKSNNKT